jgi:dipeptidase E
MLLTSAGLNTASIVAALTDLTRRPLAECTAAAIPTAANVIDGDKGWLINDYVNLQKAGFAQVDIVDVSAVDRQVWSTRLGAADVVVVTGGDTTHLLSWLRRSGLADVLPALLEDRVYVGISAGSMITGPHMALSRSDKRRPEDHVGLALVDFLIQPHLGSSFFPLSDEQNLRNAAAGFVETVFGLADDAAVRIDDGMVGIVGNGRHVRIPGRPPGPQGNGPGSALGDLAAGVGPGA